MKFQMVKKIVSIVVLSTFLFNDVSFALSPAPGSIVPATRDAMYAAGQKLFGAKKGPGSVDFDNYNPGKFVGSEFWCPPNQVPYVYGCDFAFINADYNNPPDAWKNNVILKETDLIGALLTFQHLEAKIPSQQLKIVEGWFPTDESKGELPIARIERIGEDKYVLIVHEKFVKMWNHIRENDVWFEVDLEGQRRTVSVAWGIFYRVAKHEMGDLSKRNILKNVGHVSYYLSKPHREEALANDIGGNYAVFNDAIWLWFLGSYCFADSTRYNNDTFFERMSWIVHSKEASGMGLPMEFPALLKDPSKYDQASSFAYTINYNFFVRPNVKFPKDELNFTTPQFITEYTEREAARKKAAITVAPIYATGRSSASGLSLQAQIEEDPVKKLYIELKEKNLTPRELEVLSILLTSEEHVTSSEIADHLYIEKKTVDFHIARIYEKLQVSSRMQLFIRIGGMLHDKREAGELKNGVEIIEARLSKREIEVLSLIFEGKTSKEVATDLFISKRTVDFHLTKIYRKCGITTGDGRTGIAKALWQGKLVLLGISSQKESGARSSASGDKDLRDISPNDLAGLSRVVKDYFGKNVSRAVCYSEFVSALPSQYKYVGKRVLAYVISEIASSDKTSFTIKIISGMTDTFIVTPHKEGPAVPSQKPSKKAIREEVNTMSDQTLPHYSNRLNYLKQLIKEGKVDMAVWCLFSWGSPKFAEVLQELLDNKQKVELNEEIKRHCDMLKVDSLEDYLSKPNLPGDLSSVEPKSIPWLVQELFYNRHSMQYNPRKRYGSSIYDSEYNRQREELKLLSGFAAQFSEREDGIHLLEVLVFSSKFTPMYVTRFASRGAYDVDCDLSRHYRETAGTLIKALSNKGVAVPLDIKRELKVTKSGSLRSSASGNANVSTSYDIDALIKFMHPGYMEKYTLTEFWHDFIKRETRETLANAENALANRIKRDRSIIRRYLAGGAICGIIGIGSIVISEWIPSLIFTEVGVVLFGIAFYHHIAKQIPAALLSEGLEKAKKESVAEETVSEQRGAAVQGGNRASASGDGKTFKDLQEAGDDAAMLARYMSRDIGSETRYKIAKNILEISDQYKGVTARDMVKFARRHFGSIKLLTSRLRESLPASAGDEDTFENRVLMAEVGARDFQEQVRQYISLLPSSSIGETITTGISRFVQGETGDDVARKSASGATVSEIIDEYYVRIAKAKGPGSLELTPVEISQFYPIYEELNTVPVEIYLAQNTAKSLVDSIKAEIKNLNNRIRERTGSEVDAITIKPFTSGNLEAKLKQKNDNVRRVFVNDPSSTTDVFKAILAESPELLRANRLITVEIEKGKDDIENAVHQAWLIKVSILSALLTENNISTVGAALRAELADKVEGDVDEFVSTLAQEEGANASPESISKRVSYFLGKTIKLTTLIAEQLRILKAFWTAA